MLSFLLLVLPFIHAFDNGAPSSRLPPMGWSSWVALGPGASHPIFDFCDEQSVMAAADAFVELGFPQAGYKHFHLDDCWAGGRDNVTGMLYPEKDHFPNGMKKIVDYVHSKGLVFGLYTCGGTLTCVGGRPGSKDHWDHDAKAFADWGVDWVKMDWCNTAGMDIKTSYTAMSRALNQTSRKIHFNMCEWGRENPWEWGNDVAQSWRMSGDHTGIWSSTKSSARQSAAIPENFSGRPYGWNDMDMLQTGCYEQCAFANGKEGNMTATEYMTEFSLWAISASPLAFTSPIMNCTAMVEPDATCNVSLVKQNSAATCKLDVSFGCNPDMHTMWIDQGCRGVFDCDGYKEVSCDVNGAGRHTCTCGPAPPVKCTAWISPLQRKILFNTDVIAVNQDVTPQGRPVVAGDLRVWARHMSDKSVAVALYNEADAATTITFSFHTVGWPATQKATARDLWEHKDLGEFTGSFTPTLVAPHEAKMLRFTPVP